MAQTIHTTSAGYDAILAGLRLLADALQRGEVRPNDGDIGDILTCSGAHPGLTASQIHDIADALAEGQE